MAVFLLLMLMLAFFLILFCDLLCCQVSFTASNFFKRNAISTTWSHELLELYLFFFLFFVFAFAVAARFTT